MSKTEKTWNNNQMMELLQSHSNKLDMIIERVYPEITGEIESMATPTNFSGAVGMDVYTNLLKSWIKNKISDATKPIMNITCHVQSSTGKLAKKLKKTRRAVKDMQGEINAHTLKLFHLEMVTIAYTTALEKMLREYATEMHLPPDIATLLDEDFQKTLQRLKANPRKELGAIENELHHATSITWDEDESGCGEYDCNGCNHSCSYDCDDDDEGYEFDVDELKETILEMDDQRQKLKAILIERGLTDLADMIPAPISFDD